MSKLADVVLLLIDLGLFALFLILLQHLLS